MRTGFGSDAGRVEEAGERGIREIAGDSRPGAHGTHAEGHRLHETSARAEPAGTDGGRQRYGGQDIGEDLCKGLKSRWLTYRPSLRRENRCAWECGLRHGGPGNG